MTMCMRMLFPILFLLIALLPVKADDLSESEREQIAVQLKKIQEALDSKVDASFRAAISAYSAAVGSDQAAEELHLKCVEKVDFTDQGKKPADFREWRRKNDEKLSEPGRGMALRLQLRWTILTLRAASKNTDRESLIPSVQEMVDTIARDSANLRPHQQILSQSVLGSPFAKAYNISGVKLDKWPTAPGQIEQIYDQILMPPLRRPDRVAMLRTAWIRRIQQVMLMQGVGEEVSESGSRKISSSPTETAKKDNFRAEALPRLEWQMEVDLFKSGDERAASNRMLSHMGKYASHKSLREWGEEFSNLLYPPAEEVTPDTEPAPTATKKTPEQ